MCWIGSGRWKLSRGNMGTRLFVILKALRVIDLPGDTYWLCLLLAIELPAYARLWLYWRASR